MKGYVIDVKQRNWAVLCLQNYACGQTICIENRAFYFRSKKEAIKFAEDKSGKYLVYIYKRVKTILPWCKRLQDFLFSEV